MKTRIIAFLIFAVTATAFTSDKTATPEDAKRVVETFMRQIEFVVNSGKTNLATNQKTVLEKVQQLLIQSDLGFWTGPNFMADDIKNDCAGIKFNKYFETRLGTAIENLELSSYKLLKVEYYGEKKQPGLSKGGDPTSYCIRTQQRINNQRETGFEFTVDIATNKIKYVRLTNCSANLQTAQTSTEAINNAETNFTNGNMPQAFNNYTLATQLNPQDGEAYYRLAVMYYRGIGCKKNYKKVREYIDKAILYGNSTIKRKAKNFKEYINE